MVLLLVVALLLTGVLAFQAYRSEEYHQETAGSILQDYAELAADREALAGAVDRAPC